MHLHGYLMKQHNQGVDMATYKELLVQQQALNKQIEEAREAELAEAKAKVRVLISTQS